MIKFLVANHTVAFLVNTAYLVNKSKILICCHLLKKMQNDANENDQILLHSSKMTEKKIYVYNRKGQKRGKKDYFLSFNCP